MQVSLIPICPEYLHFRAQDPENISARAMTQRHTLDSDQWHDYRVAAKKMIMFIESRGSLGVCGAKRFNASVRVSTEVFQVGEIGP
jgi:hypothetical protein